jgi:hypothetical protein
MMKNIFWAIIVMLASVLLGYIAYQEYKRETKLVESSIEVDAEVIDNIRSGKMYHPILTYTYKDVTYKGQASNEGSNPSIYFVGEHVTAYLNSNNPSEIEIKSFMNQMGKSFILLFFSILCFFASIRLFQMKE